MGCVPSLFSSDGMYKVLIKTGDLKGAGTDANVYLVLRGGNGLDSGEIPLDAFLRNDFERGNVDDFMIKNEIDIGEIAEIELWRDSTGLGDNWNVEVITIEDLAKKMTLKFPLHRWIAADKRYRVQPYDSCLPQNAPYPQERAEELTSRREMYEYKESFPGLPLQVKNLPEDEVFSDSYMFDLTKRKIKLMAEKTWISIMNDTGTFQSLEAVKEVFDQFPSLDAPKGIDRWREDVYFGNQRLNGCNPKLLRLCKALPEKFKVDAECVKASLEGSTLEAAIAAKKIFYVDLTILKGVSTRDGTKLCNPYALYYVNSAKDLVPVAIQLYDEPSATNPVFYPSDKPDVWLMAKMWYNNSDVQYHQSTVHLGATHLVMESVCVCTNRHLSISHPVYKLLAPHFLFLLAINDRALAKLVSEGGWIDLTMTVGRIGLFEIVAKRYKDYDVTLDGDLMKDLENRGVLDENLLPNYYYRDDALLLYNAITEYVTKMINNFYGTEADIINDTELQAWGKELVAPRMDGIGLNGVPNNGHFTNHAHVISMVRYIVYTCSVEHAAVNFNQYDNYAFPPAYPAKLLGTPPTHKEVNVTDDDLVKILCTKAQMLDTMIITKILSERATQALGDFEVVYHHHPDAIKITDRFRTQLKNISNVITKRNSYRRFPYEILDPAHIPNAISI